MTVALMRDSSVLDEFFYIQVGSCEPWQRSNRPVQEMTWKNHNNKTIKIRTGFLTKLPLTAAAAP